MHIVIVTGPSGAGKSTALRALEDIEFFCVDNIPMPLVAQMVDHLTLEGDRDKLAIALLSFGFKHGLPIELNHVFDVRFLPNPYFEPMLSHLDGRDARVASYVLGPDGLELVRQVEGILRFSLPQFQKEGKLYVT